MQGDFRRFIAKPEIRKTTEIKKHLGNAPGNRWVFADDRVLPEANIYLIARNVKGLSAKPEQYVEPHKHDVDSFFVLIGDEEGLKGLEAEVTMESKVFTVSSPAMVFIPKDVSHYYRLVRGSGKFLNIVLDKNYNKITK